MVRYGEGFFTSLGFEPLPEDVLGALAVRQARAIATSSATPAPGTSTANDDLRLKMCIKITDEDFMTVHHELGHNFYQRAYNKQPLLFRDGANDGFHEAIGDTIALSVTPAYLVKVGLLDKAPGRPKDIGLLLAQRALDKVAFLPFGLLVDQWRWKVFSGEITPDALQQGLVGAAAQVPGRRPAGAAQREGLRSGRQVPRRRRTCRTHATSSRASCSSSSTARWRRRPASPARSTAARSTATRTPARGSTAMLEHGLSSTPWPDALAALTGERRMDATAIVDYFAPLKKWLDEQNRGKPTGW